MDFLYRLYFALPNFGKVGLAGKIVNRGLAIALKKTLDAFVPSKLKSSADTSYGLNTEPRDEVYIVSMTSFPARIADIWITVDIILRQSFKPDQVILWLAKDQFDGVPLPENLMALTDRGLTIRFCDEDLRAHKKYYYALSEFSDANIITIDDDLYYDSDFLKNLVLLHKKHPKCIVTNRAHRITFDEDGKLLPYRRWKHNVTDSEPSHLLVATGGAGTLYPKGCFNAQVFNKELFKEMCFFADDIWLKIMALLNGTKVVTNQTYNKDFVTIRSSQKQKLVTTNVLHGGNDEQLNNIMKHFNISDQRFFSESQESKH
jgi:hypothetical protein